MTERPGHVESSWQRDKSLTTSPASKSPASRHRPQNPSQWKGGATAIVAVVALAACIVGLRNDFVYDDILIILHDDRIANPARWLSFWTSSYWPPPHARDLYRPVASLIMAVQFVLGGGTPIVFRVVSYALYAMSAVLVFRLAAWTLSRNQAWIVGLLFAAHPVHVEAVALGVNQGELVVAILACAATIFYLDRRRDGPLEVRDWIVLGAAYATAALTKENGFMVPGLLIAAESFVVDARPWRERIRLVGGGFIGLTLLGSVLVAIRAAVLGGNVVGAYTAEALVGLDLPGRLLTMLRVVPIWLRLLVWPAHLQVDYSPDEVVASTSFGVMELSGLLIVMAVVGIAVGSRRRIPAVSFGLAWGAISLFPVSNVVPTSITVAERTLFLPSVGFSIACVALVAAALESKLGGHLRTAAIATCGVLIVLGVLRSAQRETTWRNAVRFWRTAAIDAPRSRRVKAARLQAVRDLTREFEPAIASSSTPWEVRNQLAALLRAMNEDSAAEQQLRMSLAQRPDQPDASEDLVAAMLALGRYRDATELIDSLSHTSESASPDATLRLLRGIADSALRVGAPPGAVRLYLRHSTSR